MFPGLILAFAVISKHIVNLWGLQVDAGTMCALICGESCGVSSCVVYILMMIVVVEGSPLHRLV